MGMLISSFVNIVRQMSADEIRTLISSGLDADYYLRTNPDVQAAQWQALDHYLQHGWREGRSPSAHYAASSGMFDRVGLQAMGIDPFALFLLMRAASPLPEANGAVLTDPLSSFRMRQYADYTSTLLGGADWTGVAVEAAHHDPLRWSAAKLRHELRDRVGQRIVLLPDQEWPGAMEIARMLDEQPTVFLHFGKASDGNPWAAVLSRVFHLADSKAPQLLVDVVRGLAPPRVIDLGAAAFRVAARQYDAALAQRETRFVSLAPQTDDVAGFAWVRCVAVPAGDGASQLAYSTEELRSLVTDICDHAL